MSVAVTSLLALLEAFLPQLSTASAAMIQTVINLLVAWVPLLIAEYKALLPIVQNVIATLEANSSTTADQLATLKVLSGQIDASFDAAAAAAAAEDAAALGAIPATS